MKSSINDDKLVGAVGSLPGSSQLSTSTTMQYQVLTSASLVTETTGSGPWLDTADEVRAIAPRSTSVGKTVRTDTD